MRGAEILYLYEAGGRKFYRSFYDDIEIIWPLTVASVLSILARGYSGGAYFIRCVVFLSVRIVGGVSA